MKVMTTTNTQKMADPPMTQSTSEGRFASPGATSRLGLAAIELARRGMAVFPIRARDKRPATRHGVKDATRDIEVVQAWWSGWGEANIGIACGSISGVFVVDIDGDAGEDSLDQLEQRHGALPRTVETITGGGGRHLFFRMPSHPVRNSAGLLGVGLDVRGDGGYVIAPPSVHPSGPTYRWRPGCARSFAAAPTWLLEKITAHTNGQKRITERWHNTLAEPIPEGRRNHTLARVAGLLIFHGIDAPTAFMLLQSVNHARCRPPLSSAEVERILMSIGQAELRKRAAAL